MAKRHTEVIIIGAGPYGLSAAAHLRHIGLDTHVFGDPMVFWSRQMPHGMLLRSSWDASHIADPTRSHTLEAFEADKGIELSRPIELGRFVEYGQWFQQRVAPDLDRRRVTSVRYVDGQFTVSGQDGEMTSATRLVVATGLENFANMPPVLAEIDSKLATHAADHDNLSEFAGKKLAIIGGGQSALETAAIAHEAGADVEVLVRRPSVIWLQRSLKRHQQEGFVRRMMYPPTDVGPPGLNQIVCRPYLFRSFPSDVRDKIAYRSIRPAAAGWLVPRTASVQVTSGVAISTAVTEGDSVMLSLSDGSSRRVDHVIAATGYRIDAAKYEFLDAAIRRELRTDRGYPILRPGLESSIPGLHFIGASSAISFGPVMRFVSGTTFTGRELMRHLTPSASSRASRDEEARAA